ncbi:MAG: hypothetical protein M3O36_11310 [Myxococcota bacterium]|nr:hypothetical protein [Myxococcota bacterium]
MRRLPAARRFAVPSICAITVLLSTPTAHADVSSWLAFGSGIASQRNHDTSTRTLSPMLTYSLGVGSPSANDVVVGGLLRGTTRLNLGTDLGVAARVASRGFARGDWGVAIEAGAAWRPWRGGSYGEWPLQAALTAGLPWGFQVALGGELWSVSGTTPAQGLYVAVELDLLRLTVMRQGSTERWWRNPLPAGARSAAALTR